MIAHSPTPRRREAGSGSWPRKELDHPLMVLRVQPGDDRRTFFGYATNLSRSGLRIDATKPRDPGEVYEIEFSLPEPLEGDARCRCVVVWRRDWARCTKPGMGLRFLDLPEELAARLSAWVDRQLDRDQFRPTGTC